MISLPGLTNADNQNDLNFKGYVKPSKMQGNHVLRILVAVGLLGTRDLHLQAELCVCNADFVTALLGEDLHGSAWLLLALLVGCAWLELVLLVGCAWLLLVLLLGGARLLRDLSGALVLKLPLRV